MTAIRHFKFTNSSNHHYCNVIVYFNENHSCCSVQFSEFSHSVFAHSFTQTNFFTLYGDKDARSLFTI